MRLIMDCLISFIGLSFFNFVAMDEKGEVYESRKARREIRIKPSSILQDLVLLSDNGSFLNKCSYTGNDAPTPHLNIVR